MKRIARYHTKANVALSILLALVIFASVISFIDVSSSVAYALEDEDTFTQVFPTANYLQTTSPTLIGGNERHLVIYDDTKSTIFVLDNTSNKTRVLHIDLENVDNIFVLDSLVIFIDGTSCHSLDLSAEEPAIIKDLSLPVDEESYLTSDGKYLYIHQPSGYMSVYDSTLTPAFEADNIQSKLYGAIVITGESNNVYAFTSFYGITALSTLNLSTLQTSSTQIDLTVYSAYVGDVIFALANNTITNSNNLVCLDKENGTILLQTKINPQSYFAFGNTLYTIENNSVSVYMLTGDNSALNKLTTISMTGSDKGHLNNPGDLIFSNDKITVCDTQNNRLSVIDSIGASTIDFEESPIAICKGTMTYVVFENKLCKISADGIVVDTYEMDDIKDAVYLDKLYVLTSDSVYTFIGDTPLQLTSDLENAKRIACAANGKNIYILTDDAVVAITPKGAVLPNPIVDDFSNAVDLAVDYEGKVFVAFDNQIQTYLRDEQEVIDVKNATLNATLTSICLEGENLYFTAKESFVGVMSVNAMTKDKYQAPTIDISSNAEFEFVTPKENALYYSIDNRCDNTCFADDATLLVLCDVACEDGYVYALNKDTLVKIDKTQFDMAETTTLSGEYVTTEQTTLYTIPYGESKIDIDVDTHLTIISDVANYDDNIWVLATYEGKTYFVKRAVLTEYIEIIPEKDKVYGKANADRVGGVISVYTSPDTNGEVLCEIVDGSKVEVLEELDDFYLVTFDGKVGYVIKEQLKIEGLTTVQIVAIILSVIVALAGITIFASIHLTKKNNDEKEKSGKFIR